MDHTVTILRKVALLEDSYFLQYMQLTWAYYQDLASEETQELDIFQNFSQHLTLLEQAVTLFTKCYPCHCIASKGSAIKNDNSCTVMRLRAQLMESFNLLISTIETSTLMSDEATDKSNRDRFFQAITEAYKNIRNTPKEAVQYSDCFKTCKLCQACPLRPQCLRRKQEEEENGPCPPDHLLSAFRETNQRD